jgi:hypothetical protein
MMERARKLLGRWARGACYAAVAVVVLALACRLWKGIGYVRGGEMTPAEMLEDMMDWMTGREPW